jgi:putative ABC transport system substrate-binding protein
MKRRDFVRAAVTSVLSWPIAAGAQPNKILRIGFLGLTASNSLPKRLAAFHKGLRELGYQEGRDFVIEYRWADGKYDRLPALFADLIASKVDVIVTHGTPGVMAAKRATSTIPVVMAVVGDALGSNLVSSLARPDGNVTGSTFFQPELAAKRLELLKESMPDLTDVGILLNPANLMNEPLMPQVREVAASLKLSVHQFGARSPAEFDGAFAAMSAQHIGAFVVVDDAMLLANAPVLAALALKQRLPSCGWSDFAVAGGLMSYGVDFAELYRRAATFVVKIHKGAKVGDLPVERASKFELMVNLKTAKVLGFAVPPSLLARADEAIE